MKVTPRVPVHGNFQTCTEFVEMRYFRCGEKSLSTAFLFGLFEEARLPGSRDMQAELREGISEIENGLRRPAEFLLDRSVSNEDFLAAWNCCESTCISAEATMAKVIEANIELNQPQEDVIFNVLHVVIVRITEKRQKEKGITQLLWESVEGGVALFYPKYVIESFVVSPCNHLHLKYQLFAEARKRINHPITQRELASYPVYCPYEPCRVSISEFVFWLGKVTSACGSLCNYERIVNLMFSTAAELSSDDESSTKDMGRCCVCKSQEGNLKCVKNCVLCVACAAASCYTKNQLRCPHCGWTIVKDMIPTVISMAMTVVGARFLPELVLCDGCGEERPKAMFGKYWRMEHNCFLCDFCLSGPELKRIHFTKCFACSCEFSERDQELIANEESKKTHSQKSICETCRIGWEQTKFSIRNSMNHRCNICNICLLRNVFEGLCPKCSTLYSESDTSKLKKIRTTSKSPCPCERDKSRCLISCSRKCLCSVCILSSFLQTGSMACPICQEVCEGSFPTEVFCSGCMHPLSHSYDGRHKVFAVCSKGCILCPLCIEVEQHAFMCHICKIEVAVRYSDEILRIRSQNELGCYCGKPADRIILLSCGHPAHAECEKDVFYCYICRRCLQSSSRIIKIEDYLKFTEKINESSVTKSIINLF